MVWPENSFVNLQLQIRPCRTTRRHSTRSTSRPPDGTIKSSSIPPRMPTNNPPTKQPDLHRDRPIQLGLGQQSPHLLLIRAELRLRRCNSSGHIPHSALTNSTRLSWVEHTKASSPRWQAHLSSTKKLHQLGIFRCARTWVGRMGLLHETLHNFNLSAQPRSNWATSTRPKCTANGRVQLLNWVETL